MKDRQEIQKQTLKSITLRYRFAVLLIAFFSIFAFLYNKHHHHTMGEDFGIINLSGRQRMLSQRIALLVVQDKHSLAEQSIGEFTKALEYLKKTRFVSESYPAIYNLYKGPQGIEELSKNYLNLVNESRRSPAFNQQVFEVSQKILKKFDKATLLKQRFSEAEYGKRLYLEVVILLATLMLLFLEVMGIFRPMVKKVESSFEKLNNFEEKSFNQARLVNIGEVASSIGHEMSNPLGVISNSADLALRINQKKYHDSSLNNLLEKIMKHSDRVNRILQSMKTQSRKASADPKFPTPLNLIVDDAVELFSSRLKMENIVLNRNGLDEVNINCRHAEISQVVANLISNAIDALAEVNIESKEIVIEAQQTENSGLVVRVIDNGEGVPKGLENKIFESFISTKMQGKGTGLGLAISKKIMIEHEGNLVLNTEINRSCFELHFPQSV